MQTQIGGGHITSVRRETSRVPTEQFVGFDLNVHLIKRRLPELYGRQQNIWWSCAVSPDVSLWLPSEKFLMKLIHWNVRGVNSAVAGCIFNGRKAWPGSLPGPQVHWELLQKRERCPERHQSGDVWGVEVCTCDNRSTYFMCCTVCLRECSADRKGSGAACRYEAFNNRTSPPLYNVYFMVPISLCFVLTIWKTLIKMQIFWKVIN